MENCSFFSSRMGNVVSSATTVISTGALTRPRHVVAIIAEGNARNCNCSRSSSSPTTKVIVVLRHDCNFKEPLLNVESHIMENTA